MALAYTVFHLNLMYSAVEEQKRPDVVRQAYWPLLELARDHGPLGIEATGETLAEIASLDPRWLDELRRLLSVGRCEFVGSGFAQIIGPIVPAMVNSVNLEQGSVVYEELLGQRPRIAYVNEQAYSSSLIGLYLAAGYEGLIMEWNNPAQLHPEWPDDLRLLPQRAVGAGTSMPLIWNDSITFQKLQAYAHGELDLDEYMTALDQRCQRHVAALPIYGSDAEVFDFRPRRYNTESDIHAAGEWGRIACALDCITSSGKFSLTTPSGVLALMTEIGAGTLLQLESPAEPIPVKKQPKYNITRWAISGRDDLGANGSCWRIYQGMSTRATSATDWRDLCSLWSSDFRTHVSSERWTTFSNRLHELESRFPRSQEDPGIISAGTNPVSDDVVVTVAGRWLTVETASVTVRLNTRRGLAVDGLWFGSTDAPPICGTLAHGYYADVRMAADFYTGLTTVEVPGRRRVTDLQQTIPTIQLDDAQGMVLVTAEISTELGPIVKQLRVGRSATRLELAYLFDWADLPPSTVRAGAITLVPSHFDRQSLYYMTHLGGWEPETFFLAGEEVAHDRAVSALISASSALGATEGWVELGDARSGIRVSLDRRVSAAVPLLSYREVRPSFFCRLLWSLGEYDDTTTVTARPPPRGLVLGLTPATRTISVPEGRSPGVVRPHVREP